MKRPDTEDARYRTNHNLRITHSHVDHLLDYIEFLEDEIDNLRLEMIEEYPE